MLFEMVPSSGPKGIRHMSDMLMFSVLREPSAVFWISGPDANTFLGGQFSQELKISPGRVAYGLWLNQKGKVVADSEIARFGPEEHMVFAARTGAELIRKRLEDYLIADEVAIDDRSAAWSVFSVWGAAARARLSAAFPGLAEERTLVRAEGALLFPERGGRHGRFWVLAPRERADGWRARLGALGAVEADEAAATRDRIRAGIPVVPGDIGPDDLPNEGGLEEVAVSYTKGCYLGQEVMSRLKNLGQVRRRLVRVRGRGAVPAPRTPLHQESGRVGEVRTAAPDGDGWVGFAMVSLVTYQPGATATLGAGGPPVEVAVHG
jgi:folate-binding protein YgfZ